MIDKKMIIAQGHFLCSLEKPDMASIFRKPLSIILLILKSSI